jgi:hypothetical protein
MRVRHTLLVLIVELLTGCKRAEQINYAAIPITPVTVLLAQDMMEPGLSSRDQGARDTNFNNAFKPISVVEEAHDMQGGHFTSNHIDFSPTLPLPPMPCIIATYLPFRSDVKKLNSALP